MTSPTPTRAFIIVGETGNIQCSRPCAHAENMTCVISKVAVKHAKSKAQQFSSSFLFNVRMCLQPKLASEMDENGLDLSNCFHIHW